MILLSTKIRYLSIALLLCSLFSVWFVGRRISFFNFDLLDYDVFSPDEIKIQNILRPLCEHVQDSTSPNIHEEEKMKMPEGFDFKNEEALNQFCYPYVYAKFQLKLGKNNEGQCAPESNIRGKDCQWYHMCVWNQTEDVYISSTIIQGQVWEEEMVNIAVEHINDKKTGIFIDAGANIGQYSLCAALLGHRVFAFEPIPQHVDMIRRSLALNGVSDRVHVFRNGLSDYNAQTHINFHKDNKGGSTIEKIDTEVDETITDPRFINQSRIVIDLITLDNVLPIMNTYYPSMDIIYWKADIEGYEPRMFRGAPKLFANKKPPFIIFELLGKSFNRTKCSLSNLLDALVQLDYTIKIVTRGMMEDTAIKDLKEVLGNKRAHRDLFLLKN